jgi:hypothetical protein
MNLIRLFPVVVLLGLSGPLAAQGWFEYTSQIDKFTVNFPAEPAITEIDYPSEYGAMFPGRVYTAKSGENVYKVTVIDYRDAEAIHLARTNSTEADSPERYDYWRVDVLASVAYAATTYRKRGGEVTYDAWAHIDRVPGLQLQLTDDDGSRSYVGIYLHERQLYVTDATVPASSPPQGHFQQSLGFVDDEGQRIRYNYDENSRVVTGVGNHVRSNWTRNRN